MSQGLSGGGDLAALKDQGQAFLLESPKFPLKVLASKVADNEWRLLSPVYQGLSQVFTLIVKLHSNLMRSL